MSLDDLTPDTLTDASAQEVLSELVEKARERHARIARERAKRTRKAAARRVG